MSTPSFFSLNFAAAFSAMACLYFSKPFFLSLESCSADLSSEESGGRTAVLDTKFAGGWRLRSDARELVEAWLNAPPRGDASGHFDGGRLSGGADGSLIQRLASRRLGGPQAAGVDCSLCCWRLHNTSGRRAGTRSGGGGSQMVGSGLNRSSGSSSSSRVQRHGFVNRFRANSISARYNRKTFYTLRGGGHQKKVCTFFTQCLDTLATKKIDDHSESFFCRTLLEPFFETSQNPPPFSL